MNDQYTCDILIKSNYFSASTPILEHGPQNQTVLDGKDATLMCRAVGAPTPNITWIYNGMNRLSLFIFCALTICYVAAY